MTVHTCTVFDPACYRCQLNLDEQGVNEQGVTDDDKHEAAALWGAAENTAFPLDQRLAAALRALELVFPEGNES